MNATSAAKIKMMQASCHCLTLGLLALLPFIGLLFAIAAAWTVGQVRAKEKLFWNPARPQRIIGAVCACLGTVIWGWTDIFLIYRAFGS